MTVRTGDEFSSNQAEHFWQMLRSVQPGEYWEAFDRIHTTTVACSLLSPYKSLSAAAHDAYDRRSGWSSSGIGDVQMAGRTPRLAKEFWILDIRTVINNEEPSETELTACRSLLQQFLAIKIRKAPQTDAVLTADSDLPIRLQVSPVGLIGYIWLQVADQISRGAAPRRCERHLCGKPFVVNPRSKPRSGKYCSEACRQYEYRKRAKARKLATEGLSEISIGECIRYPVSTVRTWLQR